MLGEWATKEKTGYTIVVMVVMKVKVNTIKLEILTILIPTVSPRYILPLTNIHRPGVGGL